MTYERKDNTFSAFKNKRKEEKTHADLTGEAMIDGQMYWINIWKKTDKNGDTWLSGSIRKKNAKQETAKAKTDQAYAPDSFDSEIPF